MAIDGFAKHLHTARYSLAGTADDERYIGILDAEYGKSERRPNGDCTYRIWESGQMVVRGEHCTNEGSSILFVNRVARSEEHTSELQSLMRISYAVFCLKKKTQTQSTNKLNNDNHNTQHLYASNRNK